MADGRKPFRLYSNLYAFDNSPKPWGFLMGKKRKIPRIDSPALTQQQSESGMIGFVNRQWEEHPARGLTPQRLHAILTNAEHGSLQNQTDLFTDMEERDAHLFSEISKRKRALLGVDWLIEPPKNASAKEKALAEEVTDWVENIPDLEDVVFNALDGIGHGYSAQEISWERLGALWLPCGIEWQQPRHFQFPTLMSGLSQDEVRLRDTTVDGAELWEAGWLVHLHKAKSGYAYRAGLHRVLAWPYLFKNYAVRDLAELLEIYGLPLRLGKYPPGASRDEKMDLLRAVTQIGHNAAGIIPAGMSIDFEKAAEGTSAPHETMIKWAEMSMSKAILGGTLTTQADGKTSTNALGNVHNEVRKELTESDAKQLASTFNRGLISVMLKINYPDLDPRRYPKFRFDLTEPEDITVYAEALPKLVGTGMRIPESWAKKKLGIPEPEGDEPLLRVEAVTPQDKPPVPVTATPEPEPDTNTPPTNETMKPAAPPVPKPSRIKRLAALSQQLPGVAPDQQALDNAISGLLAQDLDAQGRALLDPIMNMLSGCSSLDEAQSRLDRYVPGQTPEVMTARLSQLIFASDIWGRLSVMEELNDA